MNSASILGLFGTLIGLVRSLPQLIVLLRAREALGVSVDTAATSSVVSFGWAAYGLMTGQPFVTLATGSSGLVFLLITLFALKYGRRPGEVKIAPFWLLVLVLAGILASARGLGFLLPVRVLVSNIPQIRVAWREADLSDLSLGTWLLSVSDGDVWGCYPILQHDLSIMVFAVFQLVTSGLIVMRKLMNRPGRRAVL